MGNSSAKQERCKSEILRESNPEYDELRNVLISASISNPSLHSLTRVQISRSEKIRMQTSITRFNHETYRDLALKYARDHNLEDTIPDSVLKFMKDFLDKYTQDDHFLDTITAFLEKVKSPISGHIETFQQCVDDKPFPSYEMRPLSLENRLFLHTMYYLHINKVIVQLLLEEEDDKVREIIRYIALSHSILHVHTVDFEDLTVRFIRHILTEDKNFEEILPSMVYYFKTINELITAQLHAIRKKSLEYESSSYASVLPRVNYRDLKSWKTIVLDVRKKFNREISTLDAAPTYKTQQSDAAENNANVDNETWRINRCLRRGCKYSLHRKETSSNLFSRRKITDIMKKNTK